MENLRGHSKVPTTSLPLAAIPFHFKSRRFETLMVFGNGCHIRTEPTVTSRMMGRCVMKVHAVQMCFANYTLMVARMLHAKTLIVFCWPHYHLNALCVLLFVFQMALKDDVDVAFAPIVIERKYGLGQH